MPPKRTADQARLSDYVSPSHSPPTMAQKLRPRALRAGVVDLKTRIRAGRAQTEAKDVTGPSGSSKKRRPSVESEADDDGVDITFEGHSMGARKSKQKTLAKASRRSAGSSQRQTVSISRRPTSPSLPIPTLSTIPHTAFVSGKWSRRLCPYPP